MEDHAKHSKHFTRNVLIFVTLASLTVAGAVYFFSTAPSIDSGECDEISVGFIVKGVLPTWAGGRNDKIGTVKSLWACANAYRKDHAIYTIASFCLVYIALQTFAIPGPIVLSVLAGALYPFFWAQVLVAACATTGASLCYFLSYLLGRGVLHHVIPDMLDNFSSKIKENKDNLFYYILFLRVTPLLPNWFVNIACPLVDVEFKYFFAGTLLGLVPANFLHISTGATLHSAAEASGSSGLFNFVLLFCLQFVALLPTLFKKKLASMESKRFNKRK